MDFENTFTVNAPIDEVYAAMLDLERVAPAMPGAQVLERTGDDSYKVSIKVKLGPVSMTYRGDVSIVDRDPAAHTAVLDVKAKEARGQGTATARVDMSLENDGTHTRGTMNAKVQLAGKAASMGRGIIEDVSSRLVQTFADNLGEILGDGGAAEGEAAPSAPEPGAGGGAGAATTQPPAPKPKQASAPDDGLPVGPLIAGMVADRLRNPAVLGGVLGGVLLAGYAIGRMRG